MPKNQPIKPNKQQVPSAEWAKESAPFQPEEGAITGEGGLNSVWLLGIVCALLWCRLLLPAESAEAGDTALIVFAWCLFGSISFWLGWKQKFSDFLRLDLIDLAVMLICGGSLVAGSALWLVGGQLRAAGNVSWEWIGSGLAVLLFRRLWRNAPGNLPLVVLLGLGLSLSLQGIYQHHLQFPQQREEVLPLIESWRELHAEMETPPSGEYAVRRLAEKKQNLERQLYHAGIPIDLQTQQMFLQRLYSSEAIGPFALANTLGGVLAVSILLLLFLLGESFLVNENQQTAGNARRITLFVIIGVVAYCLLLTKSRTAWVGTVVGGGFLLLGLALQHQQLQQYRRGLKQFLLIFLAVGGGIVVLAGIAFATGSLDIEVITEANKSLRYRMEYWTSTLAMLGDRWILGAGPGNFRQLYLGYKLPDSSEEILDPHNMWLDAWSGGGILSLFGTVLLVGAILFIAWRASVGRLFLTRESLPSDQEAETQKFSEEETIPTDDLFSTTYGQAAGTSLLTGILAFLLARPTIAPAFDVWLVLTFLLIVNSCLLAWICSAIKISQLALSAAAIALLVHLQGAGGFSMPAIFQLLVVMGVGWQNFRRWVWQAPVSCYPVAVGLTLLLAATAWSIVIKPGLAAIQAEAELASATSPAAVKMALSRWIAADSLSPDPWLQQASFLTSQALATQNSSQQKAGIASQQAAIQRDPQNYAGYRTLAQQQFQLAQMTGMRDDIAAAVASQQQAISRYPHLARLYVEMTDYLTSLLAHSQGEQVEELQIQREAAARKGLELHHLNDQAGHIDRLLTPAEQEKLLKLVPAEEEKTNKSTLKP